MKKVLVVLGTVIALTATFLISFPEKFIFLSTQAKISLDTLDGAYDFQANKAVYDNQSVPLPVLSNSIPTPSQGVLGKTNLPKLIVIDLANQRLYAFEGNRVIYNFLISSGKWGRTPTGLFRIWVKLRYTTMTGGSRLLGTYYFLPNVPYTMYFYNEEFSKSLGFGIHGTYWHDNFGQPMSHGCINLKTKDAAKLFSWADPDLRDRQRVYATKNNPGTEVLIYGKAPGE